LVEVSPEEGETEGFWNQPMAAKAEDDKVKNKKNPIPAARLFALYRSDKILGTWGMVTTSYEESPLIEILYYIVRQKSNPKGV
jgi:hypothetical protein